MLCVQLASDTLLCALHKWPAAAARAHTHALAGSDAENAICATDQNVTDAICVPGDDGTVCTPCFNNRGQSGRDSVPGEPCCPQFSGGCAILAPAVCAPDRKCTGCSDLGAPCCRGAPTLSFCVAVCVLLLCLLVVCGSMFVPPRCECVCCVSLRIACDTCEGLILLRKASVLDLTASAHAHSQLCKMHTCSCSNCPATQPLCPYPCAHACAHARASRQGLCSGEHGQCASFK